jgi:hypothetical protein
MQAQGVRVNQEEWQAEYDKEAAKLDEAAKATTPRAADGKFAKAEPDPVKEPEPKPEPVAEPEPVKTEAAKEPEPDPFAEMKARLEKAEKALKDTQAWGTKNAQELAAIRKERERQATRPAILDANPELEQAIKYVVPVQEINPEQVRQNEWRQIVETAHPGIFDTDIDPELEKAVLARFDGLGGAQSDPLIAIREITAEKLAFAERQLGKRLIAETAKANQKSAMSVPGAGSGGAHKATVDSDLEAVNRINSMSSAEFERERQKALKLI